jgi:hypothetical protein
VCGPGNSVGIATSNGVGGPGIESRWTQDFSYPSRPALRPTKPSVKWNLIPFAGIKRAGGYVHPYLAPRLKKK